MIQRFVLKYFERVLVLLLVASMFAINFLIEQKFAFLSFYYLPIILAGFYTIYLITPLDLAWQLQTSADRLLLQLWPTILLLLFISSRRVRAG